MNTQINMNKDNADLKPIGLPTVCIGFVDNVNGYGAREVAGFIPTQAELVELAKYWEYTFLSRAYFVFSTRQIGSTDLRLSPFAERRVTRIIDLVGVDAAEGVQQVRDDFASRVGARTWNEFCEYLGPHHIHGIPTNNGRQGSGMQSQNLTEGDGNTLLRSYEFITTLEGFETPTTYVQDQDEFLDSHTGPK